MSIFIRVVVKYIDNKKIIFVTVNNKTMDIQQFYGNVIQDKTKINRYINKIYEKIFDRYDEVKSLAENNILLTDHIQYCQYMRAQMYEKFKTTPDNIENEDYIYDLIQQITRIDKEIYKLKFSAFQINKRLFDLKKEIDQLNKDLENNYKLFNDIKEVYNKILECHMSYYNKYHDVIYPYYDLFDETMEDVD